MEILSLIFVAIGIILLGISLIPTHRICLRSQRTSSGWKFLSFLIVFFILGYALFGYQLSQGPPSPVNFNVSLILFFGSVFVVLVVRLSIISIDRIEALAAQKQYRSLHDQLTELPNRALLNDRIGCCIRTSKRRKEPFAILLLDLVRFKDINESFGHSLGDFLLQDVSKRLANIVRGSDTLSRFGGDEFVMVLPHTNVAQAVQVSLKIASSMEEPFQVEEHDINLDISIGIVVYPEGGQDSVTLLRHAETAICEAQRNEVVYYVFDPSQDSSTWNRLVMVGELREALSDNQLVLHYQPKVSLKGNKIIGVEALCRWNHPDRGEILPDNFIPLIEQAGLSKPFSNWVIDTALEQTAKWSKKGIQIKMSVNLSVKNLHDHWFPNDVENLLKKWGVHPSQLILEITESSMMVDQEKVNEIVRQLKRLGLNLSIDDFGTGYSSLSYLRKFPAKEIKIDKSFVMDMLQNEGNAVIVRSTIEMAQDIGCNVVAEGVENEETMKLLASLGCDTIQGFHVCKPISAEDFDKWLDSGEWHLKLD